MSDRLKQLLQLVDDSAPASPSRAGLTEIVRRKASAQRHRRVVESVALALAGIVVGLFAVHVEQGARTVAKTQATIQTPRGLDDVLVQAEFHQRVADALLAARKRAVVSSAAVSSDIRLERDRAALILVYEADQYVKENQPREAVAAYRRAIELFPQSHWADVARERLKQMQT